ncbi:MAG: efflux RND transporter permease subunit [Desulfobacca sp.]|uniref:efflux RND transporter permease subunit n=1 Tax=Desulfobacca sp. TaxID=2067990 RepID=UPI004048FA44
MKPPPYRRDMSLTAFVQKRPIAVSMFFAGLVLLGFLSWRRLPIELLPNINFPQLTIVINCENVGPLEIESLVTKKVETALGTVSRLRRLQSFSREGLSLVVLDFEWGTNMNYAALDIRERLDQIQDILPRETKTPMIIRFNPESLPVITLALKGESVSFADLQDMWAEKIKRELERVPGVAGARLSGAREREIQVVASQGRLLAHQIPITALLDSLKQANINFPGGKITRQQQEWRLRTVGEFKEPEEIGQVGILPGPGKTPVYIRDVATVVDTFKAEQTVAHLNGQPSLLLAIYKIADANTVAVVREVQARVQELNQEFQGRLQLIPVQDQGRYIQQAISQIQEAAVLGGVLAFVVLLLFLGTWRSALTVVTAIPISIVATFGLMYLTGVSLNMMSLGGLALAIGMLVDNGVVVLENIRRQQEMGILTPAAAINQGTDEVKLAITASTLAHIVVFLPVIFVAGLAGQLMSQLALTISFSLLVSLAVSLFFNPMLISLERGPRSQPAGAASKWPATSARWLHQVLDGVYAKILARVLAAPLRVLAVTALIFILAAFLFFTLDRELLPTLDQREFFLRVHTPANYSYDATVQRLEEVEALILANPEVATVITQLGYNPKEEYEKVLQEKEPRVGQISVTLKPRREYPGSASTFIQKVRPVLAGIPDIKVDYILPQAVNQWWGQKAEVPELLAVQGPDLAVLEQLAQEVKQKIQDIPGLQDLAVDLKKYGEETRVVLDRQRAAAFGLTMKEIGENLKVAIQGEVATQYRRPDKDVDIRVKMRPENYQEKPDFKALFIHSRDLRADIPLTSVATLESGPGWREIYRNDQIRVVPLRGNVVGRRLSATELELAQALATVPLPEGYAVTFSRELLEITYSSQALLYALALSILLVYMLLAGQFESLFHPLIILVAIPLALMGVCLILAVTGASLNIGVYLGAIMLSGIVVNNSILLVDYTNTLRRRGLALEVAVVQGCRTRLRPVVMTTLTTILGLLPLVLWRGEGSELRTPLALTVITGLAMSTFLTLLITPLFYLQGEKLLAHWRRRSQS